MRFFTTALVTLATLTTAVFAAENPITYPSAGDKVATGQATTVKWTTTTTDKTVTLILRKGESENLGVIGPICDNCPNSGTYTWTPPKTLVAGKDYSIEIKFQSGNNYSPLFEIDSSVTATTSAPKKTATTTEASTTETTTETESSTVYTSTTLVPKTEYVNNTVTVTMTGSTTTSRPRTTTSAATTSASGAPDPHNAAGLEKAVSGGLAVVAVAAWALIL